MDDTQQRLRMALDIADMAIWDASIVGGNIMDGTVEWSPEGASLLGLERRALRQSFRDFLNFVHPEDREGLVGSMQERVDQCAGYQLEYRIVRADAAVRWVSAKAHTICDQNNMPERTLGMIWDITERKRQEMQMFEQKELAEVTLSSIGDGVITTDERGRITFLNRIAEQMTGWTTRAARGVDVGDVMTLVDEATGHPFENVAHKCLRLRQAVGISSRSQLVTREGRRIAVDDSAAPIWSRDGEVLGTVAVFHDVSHERKLAHQLSWQASHDPLTGLVNRREFENHIATALHSAKNEGHHHALLFMDLDRFKIINDTCGHGAGDVLLQLLSRMLQTHMRESDVLARLGGDELGVLLSFCPPAQALTIANDIRQSIKDFRFVWDKRTFEIGVSIGLVQISEDSKSTSELLVAADQACYLAKEQGRNRVHIYRETDVMLARRHGEMLWVARLNEAFQLDRFRLFGQPIVGLRDHAVSHEEVLVRIANLDRYPGDDGDGLILPGAFIPAAERYDLMAPIDRWVIRHVCRHIHGERAEMIQFEAAGRVVPAPPELYSVNLSGISLNDDGMLDHIKAQFEEFDIEPSHICFEITETAIISNLPKAQLFIESLRELGCRFSLDDFGSGLSSFAYLRSLPVDFLKIDGVFIRDIANNEINRAMVKAINEVGHVMGIATVAEYVEDEPTLEVVRDIGIDYAQGYAVGHLHPLTKA